MTAAEAHPCTIPDCPAREHAATQSTDRDWTLWPEWWEKYERLVRRCESGCSSSVPCRENLWPEFWCQRCRAKGGA